MKESDFEKLKQYIRDWNAIDGIKPQNEPLFMFEFVKLLQNYPDEREVEFDGEGAYFGKQVTLLPFSTWGKQSNELNFEVAYDKSEIRVYSGRNNGFWWPEFIRITNVDPDFKPLYDVLIGFLKNVFGL